MWHVVSNEAVLATLAPAKADHHHRQPYARDYINTALVEHSPYPGLVTLHVLQNPKIINSAIFTAEPGLGEHILACPLASPGQEDALFDDCAARHKSAPLHALRRNWVF